MQRIIPVLSYLTILFIIIEAFSCGNTSNEEGNENIDSITKDSTGYEVILEELANEDSGQVYSIDNKAVIFFMPTKNEIKNMLLELGESYRWDAEALFNNFAKQANSFQTLVKKQNIKCAITTSKKFKINLKSGKYTIFDRIEQDQVIGQIISDGVKEPLIDFGMYSNKKLSILIENYFNIKNIGYIPTDSTESDMDEEKVIKDSLH